MLKIESRHEAAFNACGEALADLGARVSISFDPAFIDGKPYYSVTGRVDPMESYESGASSINLADAARLFVAKANEVIANPPPKALSATETKAAAKELIEQYRNADIAHEGAIGPVLDEIADRLDALQVKG